MTARVEHIGNATLYLGDCLEILPTLPKVDAVITDPPYSSGATDAARKGKSIAFTPESVTPRDVIQGDTMTTLGFMTVMRMWFRQLRDQLNHGGHVACFIDWRMYPILAALCDSAGLRSNNLVVWDKGYPGLGTGFRGQHELVMLASSGAPTWHSYDYGNVLKDTRVTSGDHPHEKPQKLMTALVDTCSPLGGTVVDTFMGSGSTGVACMAAARRFIGIEIEPKYFDIACERIENAQRQVRMFA